MQMTMRMTKRTKIIWGVLGLLVLLCGVYLLYGEQSALPNPPVESLPKSNRKADGKAKPINAEVPTPEEKKTEEKQVDFPQISAGSLGRLTELKAQEEILQYEVRIEKLKKEKAEISRSASPTPTISLPALTPPPPATVRPAPPSPAPESARRSGLTVLSVQGVGGKLSATIRTGSGQVTVQKGSRLGDGVVTDISRRGVSVRRNGKISTLPFE